LKRPLFFEAAETLTKIGSGLTPNHQKVLSLSKSLKCSVEYPSVILKAFCLKRECHLHQHYKKLFCTKVFSAAFMCLLLGFVGFCQKEISEKSTLKMLLKLTIGVNFTNNL